MLALFHRRSAVVLAALVAAMSTVFVFGASDAAQAFEKPPPTVVKLGARAMPASVAFTVPGFGTALGVGMLGYAAWENREVIVPIAEGVWCDITRCDEGTEQPPPEEWVRPDSPQSRIGAFPSTECFVTDMKIRPTDPPSEYVTIEGNVTHLDPEPMPASFTHVLKSSIQHSWDEKQWCAPSGVNTLGALPQGFVQDVFCKSPVTGLSLRLRKPPAESRQGRFGDYVAAGLGGPPVKLCPAGTIVAWASIFAPSGVYRYLDDVAGAVPWPWFAEYDAVGKAPVDGLGDPSENVWPNPSYGNALYDSGEELVYSTQPNPEPCVDPMGFPCINPDMRLIGSTECTDIITGVRRTVYSPAGRAKIVFPGCNPGEYVTARSTMLGPWTDGEIVDVTGTAIPPGVAPGPMVMPNESAMQNDYSACLSIEGCALQVVLDGDPCALDGRCYDWWSVREGNPDRLRCNWGPYLMPLTDCDPLRYAYRTGHTIPDPAGFPDMLPSPQPAPGQQPAPELDPEHQPKPVPQPNPNPNPNPEPNPPTRPRPPEPEPDPDPDPDSENCWKGAVSWNPIDWVFVPVKCALVWAFVPSDGALDGLVESTRADWDLSWPGWTITRITGIADAFPVPGGDGGCQGPPLTVNLSLVNGGTHTMYPFSACSQPMSTVAAIVKISLTVSFYMAMSFLSIKLIAGAFGWNLPNSWGSRSQNA